MNPPVFNTNAGAHLTNGGMHSFSSFFLILFIISDDLFLSTQISGPSMDCKDKEIGLLGAFTIFLIILNKTYHVRMLKLSDTYWCMYNSRMLDPLSGRLYKKH